ncbi:MAG: HAD-IA family hydrolase [Pseudomonadota bacterium]
MNLIIFDCDGTLVDSLAVQLETMRRTLEELGHRPVPDSAIRRLIGVSLPETFSILFDKPIDDYILRTVVRFKEHYHDVAAAMERKAIPYAGIAEALHELSRRDDVLMGVATGKSRRGLVDLLADEGWEDHFVALRTADDCPSKPHPAMVLEICDHCGIAPSRTLVIGDTSFDMKMAVNAGAMGLGVSWGFHAPHELTQAGATHVLETPAELVPYFGEIGFARI